MAKKDCIKAILLRSEGWNLKLIAQALRLHEGSIARHLIIFHGSIGGK
jgi:hypothetical protein